MTLPDPIYAVVDGDARALGTVEQRTAAAKATQAAFESRFAAKRYGCPCAQCRHS